MAFQYHGDGKKTSLHRNHLKEDENIQRRHVKPQHPQDHADAFERVSYPSGNNWHEADDNGSPSFHNNDTYHSFGPTPSSWNDGRHSNSASPSMGPSQSSWNDGRHSASASPSMGTVPTPMDTHMNRVDSFGYIARERLSPSLQHPPQETQTAKAPQRTTYSSNAVMKPSSGSRPYNNPTPNTGGSNAQGRALNKILLEILRERVIDPQRLAIAIDSHIERMDCVNLATLLFHSGKKRIYLTPVFIKRIAARFSVLREELRAREASNALYGLKCMSSEFPEVRQLVFALAQKVSSTSSDLVAQAVGNALYGMQMMTSDYEEVRYLISVLSKKIVQCNDLLEAQNVGNALYGLRGMSSEVKEVRALISALVPKVANAKEELNGQALGYSLYGIQSMNSKEPEVRALLTVMAEKVARTWEDLKAQDVSNALFGLRKLSSDHVEVRMLIDALVPKLASSPDILDSQAIGNCLYGLQSLRNDNPSVRALLAIMGEKVELSMVTMDGASTGNSMYGLQGMSSEHPEARALLLALTLKIEPQEVTLSGHDIEKALFGLQSMTSDCSEVRRLLLVLSQKLANVTTEMTSQEIGNALYGLKGMRSDIWETRFLIRQLALMLTKTTTLMEPSGIANSLLGLQNMSSECEDVRLLLDVLVEKIKACWKLFTAQHASAALFGLQGLSSFESEVTLIVEALAPKISSCREEMSAKQFASAMFGLQNMSSNDSAVLALVDALCEKACLCSEQFTAQNLAACLYGMQGLSDTSAQVRGIIGMLALKASSVRDMDVPSLANCFIGMQCMTSGYPEMTSLLLVLESLVTSVAATLVEFPVPLCASIFYGLQNCSCADDSVRNMLWSMVQPVRNAIASFNRDLPPPGLDMGMSKKEVGSGRRSVPLANRYADICTLYQSITLSLLSIADFDQQPDLRDSLLDLQSTLCQLVDRRKFEFRQTARLSLPESRLVVGLQSMFRNSPYHVQTAEQLFGFDTSVQIRLQTGVHVATRSGEEWSPVLNIEVLGSSHSFTSEALFQRLRSQYLSDHKGVVVHTLPARTFGSRGLTLKDVIETLRTNDYFFECLYPTDDCEDASTSNGFMSYGLKDMTDALDALRTRAISEEDCGSSFFSLVGSDPSEFEFNSNEEYFDDNLDSSIALSGSGNGVKLNLPKGSLTRWYGIMPDVSHIPILYIPHNYAAGPPGVNIIGNGSASKVGSRPNSSMTDGSNSNCDISPRSSPVVSNNANFYGDPVRHSKSPSSDVGGLPRSSSNPLHPPPPPSSPHSRGLYDTKRAGIPLGPSSYPMTTQPLSQFPQQGSQDNHRLSPALVDNRLSPAILIEDNVEDDDYDDQSSSAGNSYQKELPVGDEMDAEISMLETQLEIMRMEKKLLELKAAKLKKNSKGKR